MKLSKGRSFFSILIFLFSNLILADVPGDLDPCLVANPALLNAYRLKVNPQFFFRILPKSNRLIYASAVGVAKDNTEIDGNFLYDVDTKQAVRLPGQYDGTSTPDEKYYVAPSGNDAEESFRIFSLTGLNKESKPLIKDDKMDGAYQSVGVLKNMVGEDRYRVLIDNRTYGDNNGPLVSSTLMFKEYNLSNLVDPINQAEPRKLCSNLMYELKLPMISKDGTQMAALDPQTSTTKIFKIDGTTGSCREVNDLGLTTGKVDFSFDGEAVTFAAMKLEGAFKDGWAAAPTDDLVSNIYYYNLKEKKLKALTHFTDRNALYPTFNLDGHILARVNEPKIKDDGDNGVWILKLDPYAESRSLPTAWLNGEQSCVEENPFYASAVLGAMLEQMCTPMSEFFKLMSPQHDSLMSLSLDREQCEKLAKSWDEKKNTAFPFLLRNIGKFDLNEMEKLKVSDLLAVCPKGEVSKTHVFSMKTVQKPVDPNPKDPAKVIAARCAECHIGERPAGPPMRFDDLCSLKPFLKQQAKDSNRSISEEMYFRVSHGQVPPFPKPPLSPEETTAILNFVQHPETVKCP